MDYSLSNSNVSFFNNDVHQKNLTSSNLGATNPIDDLSEYFTSSEKDNNYNFDYHSFLTDESVEVFNDNGTRTINYFKSDDEIGTTNISDRTDGLRDIVISRSNKNEPINDTYIRFQEYNSSVNFKFTTGNQYSVSIKNNNGQLLATSSRGSLEQSYEISQDEYGYYILNDNKYMTLDEIASELNNIQIEESYDADGKFGVSKQAFNALDCGLLSAINALNYSDYGREVLKNAVTYEDDGSISVYFAGLDRTYNITQDALNTIPKLPMGDDDLRAIDCACRLAGQDILCGNIKISDNAPIWCNNEGIAGGNLSSGYYPQIIYYFMTGKDCSSEFTPDRFTRTLQLDSVELNDGILLCAASGYQTDGYFEYANVQRFDVYVPGKAVTDAFGNSIAVPDMHSYAIKDVNSKVNGSRVVTLVNPWDSSDEILLDEETYLDLFDVIYSMDIDNNNLNPMYLY